MLGLIIIVFRFLPVNNVELPMQVAVAAKEDVIYKPGHVFKLFALSSNQLQVVLEKTLFHSISVWFAHVYILNVSSGVIELLLL
jgi:RecB family exonuclease